MSERPDFRRFEPPESEVGAPFWAASRERRFVLPTCSSCGRAHWYPREVCPFCRQLTIEWREASGRGTVYASSGMPKPAMPVLADRVPYAVALVELQEGPRMMTNLVDLGDVDPHAVPIGAAVELVWEELTDGRHLPTFRLAP